MSNDHLLTSNSRICPPTGQLGTSKWVNKRDCLLLPTALGRYLRCRRVEDAGRRSIIQSRVAAEGPRLRYHSGVAFGRYTGEAIREPGTRQNHGGDLNNALDLFANVAVADCCAEVRHQLFRH